MQLNKVKPFCRPPSGQGIIQIMSEFVFSNNKILGHRYKNRLQSKAMRLFAQLKIESSNAHI